MWQVIGQTREVSLLKSALEKGSLAHAYLFVGPPHVGKMTLALNLAQALNCPAAERPCGECASCRKIASANHADVQVISLTQDASSPEAKLISIDQVREMQHSASLPPFEGSCKVFIIDSAECLSVEAANCLLKTLEEPVGRVVFLLLTSNDSLLLATVVSRCQRLELRPAATAEVESALNSRGIEPLKARLLAGLSHGCMGWALLVASDESLLQQRKEEIDRLISIINADYDERFAGAIQMAAQFAQNRGRVYGLLDLWLDYWRDLMLVKIGRSDISTNVDRLAELAEIARRYRLARIRAFAGSLRTAREQLEQNANPRLVLEVLMLDMPRKETGGEENPATRMSVKYG